MSSATLQQGLAFTLVENIKQKLACTDQEMASALGISLSTYARLKRTPNSSISQISSEKIYRILSAINTAYQTFDSEEDAELWLKYPSAELAGIPAHILLHEPGTTKVIQELRKIQQGVFA
ncbi:DUF2384 domain-containing protein [Persicirhabdus sediminis]|uniref:DUF2384 domain-containing protein n=2 Tax=Persicirhabdus sediminis TaxID=454144 RepID=A0A8J7MAS4_9BACT|nr:DUF2384 domain-containing protein [Persicirhabdus sediminis]